MKDITFAIYLTTASTSALIDKNLSHHLILLWLYSLSKQATSCPFLNEPLQNLDFELSIAIRQLLSFIPFTVAVFYY